MTEVKPTAVKDPTKTATITTGPAFIIKRMSDIPRQYLNMLVYGPPGCGKTTLAASAVDVDEMSDILLIDIEGGDLVIYDNPRIKRIDRIDSIRVTNYKQLGDVHKYLKAHCRHRDSTSTESIDVLKNAEAKFLGISPTEIQTPRRYKTIIIDSLSELDSMVLNELLGITANMDFDKLIQDGEVDVAQFAEYKKKKDDLRKIF
jgi:DNA polymerase III delta prime subunit